MRRRQLLAALPAAALAGCLSGDDDDSAPSADRTPPDGVELVEFTHPDYLRSARETPLGAVIRNAADADRSGTATLGLSPDGQEWRQLVETPFDLAPGEQATVETTVTTHFVGSLHVRLSPFDRTTRVDTTDPSLPYGGPYTLPNAISLELERPRGVDSYDYVADGQQRTATPPDGRNWYLATVTASNEGEGAAVAPYRTGFEMLGYDWQGTINYRSKDAYEGGELQPGSSRTGGILFETTAPWDDKLVQLRHPYGSGTVGATWTPPEEREGADQ